MRLVFCGTPQFAVPTLEALMAVGHEIALVVTQPDRPSGRGMQMTSSPIKSKALDASLQVTQPEKIRNNAEFRAQLERIAPDAIIIVAYGRIVPKWMLDLPRFGNINLHGSLLPKYRGAAPIQWAIANGETVTGVTTMRIDEGLDTGDMLLQREVSVGPRQTALDMYPILSQIGAMSMVETIDGLAAETIHPVQQEHSLATLAPILTREDGQMDFSFSAQRVYDRWRGFQPWPGAWTMLAGKKLTAHRLEVADIESETSLPGELRVERGRMFAACADGSWIELLDVQLEGRKRVTASEFLRGHAIRTGERFV